MSNEQQSDQHFPTTSRRVLRRSELVCPASVPERMAKALSSAADEVILDLEDAVAVGEKERARHHLVAALANVTPRTRPLVAYRINGVATPWCYRDIIDVVESAGAVIRTVVVPKARRPEDIVFVDVLLSQVERRVGLDAGRIGIEVLIETAAALHQVEAIANCSPRIQSLIFGVADFAADMGMPAFRDADRALFLPIRQRIVLAARLYGLDAIDGVTVDFRLPAAAAADAAHAASLGFDGKWAIHPAQIAPIHDAMTPTDDQIRRALAIVSAYRQAVGGRGVGAIDVEGEMVDQATFEVELRRLWRARDCGKDVELPSSL